MTNPAQPRRIVYGIVRSASDARRVVASFRGVGIEGDALSLVLDATDASAIAWLASQSEIPSLRVGTLQFAGPLRSNASGAPATSLGASLRSLGMPDARARSCEDQLRRGSILVAVHVSDGRLISEARRLFGVHGAHDVSVSAEPETPPTNLVGT